MADNAIAAPPGLDEFVATLDQPRAPASLAPQAAAAPEGLDDFVQEIQDEKYGTPGQMLKTAAEGAASANTFGASTKAETALGIAEPEDIQARRDINPVSHMVGQVAGLLIPGSLAGKALGAAGKATAAAVGLAEPATVVAKLGSGAVKAAVENSLFQSGDDVSKMFSGGLGSNPADAFETAITDIGLASVLGGGIGGALTGAGIGGKALWNATMGKEATGLLKSVASRLGGIEGEAIVDSTLDDALASTGLAEGISPEIKAAMSNDPHIQELANTLRQSDTTGSGLAYQKAETNFRTRVSEIQAETLGASPGEIPSKGDIDKYGHGKAIGETLSKEMDEIVSPLSKEYDAYKSKFQGADLIPSLSERAELVAKDQNKALKELTEANRDMQKALKSGSPEASIEAEARIQTAKDGVKAAQEAATKPGTTDSLVEKISGLAEKEGWTLSPSSEIMTEVNRVLKEIPNLKTLNQLSKYIQQIGENTASKMPFGVQTPVSRAGAMMKGILRDAESEVLGHFVGSEEGTQALANYTKLRQDYAKAAGLKDQVSASLGLKGSTSGFAKALKTMASEDGEKILQRLSGEKDAAWLKLVQERFPQTADQIKKYQAQKLLAAANDGGKISSKRLLKALDGMSPQLRDFALTPEQVGKIKSAAALEERLNSPKHNFSNTARTVDKLMGSIPGSAIGLVTAVLSHSPIVGGLVAAVAKYVGKDVPDASRLALLKFLGENKPVNAGAFKSMVELIHATMKGENQISRATKAVFTAGREVLPTHLMPTQRDRDKLDKELRKVQTDPSSLANPGDDTAHYLPNHAQAISQTTTQAAMYLNSLRPKETRQSPLDSKPVVSPTAQAAYNRALDIAQQPLVVIDAIKKGMATSQDVQHLQAMYPALYQRLSQKLLSGVEESVRKEDQIEYKTRLGLSLFLGQALDSTMTSGSIMAAQASMAPKSDGQSQNQGAEQPGQHQKHSMNALNKLPGMYQTPGQARQAKAMKD
jgi:hypothetical protein